MNEATAQQTLTPQFCFSSAELQDFLRLSRGAIDDTITQHLNALLTPAAAGFDPRTTARRLPARRQADPRACAAFRDGVLFPSWQARADVLAYCARVAARPDPAADPEAAAAAAAAATARAVDERLDPYAGRARPREARTTQLALLVRQEQGVENIVRARTWGLVRERCGEPEEDWQMALASWKREKAAGGMGGA